MVNNSAVTDIGLVSPEWLQDSFDSPELDALLSQVEVPLISDGPCIPPPTTPPTTPPTSCKDETRAPFATTTVEELRQLQSKNMNKKTVNSTKTWVNRFEVWQKVRGVALPSDPDPRQLDAILQQFYAELRKTAVNTSLTAYVLC